MPQVEWVSYSAHSSSDSAVNSHLDLLSDNGGSIDNIALDADKSATGN